MTPIIKIRKELNMPLGKICGQVSHATMLLFIKMMEVAENGQRFMTTDNFNIINDWRKNNFPLIIEFVDDKTFEMLQNNYTEINVVDNGLTCFDYQKTKTCKIQIPSKVKLTNFVDTKYDGNSNKESIKQYLIILNKNKEICKNNELEIIKQSARSSIMFLFDCLSQHKDCYKFQHQKIDIVNSWLKSFYPKIVLKIKSESKLNELKNAIGEDVLKYNLFECQNNIHVLCIGPEKSEKMPKMIPKLRLF